MPINTIRKVSTSLYHLFFLGLLVDSGLPYNVRIRTERDKEYHIKYVLYYHICWGEKTRNIFIFFLNLSTD